MIGNENLLCFPRKQRHGIPCIHDIVLIGASFIICSYCFQALDCYVKLGDWNSVQQWSQKVREMRQRMQNVEGLHAKVDMNYVK